MTTDLIRRVEQACQDLLTAGQPITFPDVAARAGTGRTTLYRRPELRAVIEEHRTRERDALTLTGLTVQLDQLRATLEALAAKVRPTKNNSASSTTANDPRRRHPKHTYITFD